MRVLVAAVASSTQASGVCRHGANLVRCLLLRKEISRVNLVVGAWAMNHFQSLVHISDERLEISIAGVSNTSFGRNRWYYSELPRLAQAVGADIVHATYPVPIHRSKYDARVAVSLHDLYPYDIPENFGYRRVLMNRLVLKHCLHEADAICCVSQNTLNRLSDRWPAWGSKASRIYNSVEQASSSETAPLPELARATFLLSVAQHRHNKNLLLTLRVFRRLVDAGKHPYLKLVIIGNDGPETTRIRSFLNTFALTDRVILLQGISDGELQWCYRNCELLLSTSSIEGFGLPVSEAVLAGCKVVCSDIPVYREVSRALCHFVPLEPRPEEAFTSAVLASLKERATRPIRLPQFRAEAVAADYVSLYRNLILNKRISATRKLEPRLGLLTRKDTFQ